MNITLNFSASFSQIDDYEDGDYDGIRLVTSHFSFFVKRNSQYEYELSDSLSQVDDYDDYDMDSIDDYDG